MAVNPVPEGYRSVNAYLIVEDAAKALDFYARAFGATGALPAADRTVATRSAMPRSASATPS